MSRLLEESSRTFYVGIQRLPRRLRPAVRVAYLLLRVSDYLEDNQVMSALEKEELLLLWEEIINGTAGFEKLRPRLQLGEDLEADALVASHGELVLDALGKLPERLRRHIVRHVADSTRGMARWARRGPDFHTEDDLDDYMHEVAGRVGYLLTDLFTDHSALIRRRRAGLMDTAREFGLALQTVNILRGLRSDFQRGWIYVPESVVRPLGISRPDLFKAEHDHRAMEAVDWLGQKADRHLASARQYIKLLPVAHHTIRLFCLYPYLFAVRTLALSRNDRRVLGEGVKVPRHEVRHIVRAASVRGWSNRWLDSYADRLAMTPASG